MTQSRDEDDLDWDRERDGLMADAASPDNTVTTETYTPSEED